MTGLKQTGEAGHILEKAASGVTFKDAVDLLEYDLNTIGAAADHLRQKAVGDLVTFVIDTTINYTNVCTSGCKFCAYYRRAGDKDAYVLNIDEILEKVSNAAKLGATQVLIQGGLNPDLPIEYYEDVIKTVRDKFPNVQRHFFSAPEISFIAKTSGSSVKETLERLIDAGLQSIPGGGAELLDDDIRKKISPNKISWGQWKRVMITAHKLGLKTSATMVYGFGESKKTRIKHILRLREIQEKTEGFTAFIPWSFQPEHTELYDEGPPATGGIDYLEVIALSRILLAGAIDNIQCSWLTEGAKLGQVALFYGANDFSGTIIEENVVKAAGVNSTPMPAQEIVRLINESGRPAAQRDTLYKIVKSYG
ncbi:MAG: dehypoxanthine futalosine cyclase [Candidatus Altiarchaeales archaeon IMC4]|nr:MAG: dehypoxanthine futalosine cyclase [Candidatus Altiarchaeales archaeon IMC4]